MTHPPRTYLEPSSQELAERLIDQAIQAIEHEPVFVEKLQWDEDRFRRMLEARLASNATNPFQSRWTVERIQHYAILDTVRYIVYRHRCACDQELQSRWGQIDAQIHATVSNLHQ